MQPRSRIQSRGFSKPETQREQRARRKKSRTAANHRLAQGVKNASVATMTGSVSGAAVAKVVKADPRGERAHKDALAVLGCMVCRRLFPFLAPGPVELHHLRGGGWGKGGYTTLIPLCVEHHRGATGVHGLGTKRFPKHYGFDQADLLMDALTLVQKGATCPT